MGRETKFYIVDAFTSNRFEGNPAGVVIASRPLTEPEMFDIAAEMHLETAFLWPAQSSRTSQRIASSSAAYSICYYTHVARIPLCGHDTIATGAVLVHRGELALPGSGDSRVPSRIVFMSDIGDLPIEVLSDGSIAMRQGLPQYGSEVDASEVLTALGLASSHLNEHPIRVVSTGTPFLFVGADIPRSIDILAPDMPVLKQAIADLSGTAVAGVYVWADDRTGRTQTIYGRCFAPGAGLPEDPVTGSASGALGAHLFELGLLRGDVTGAATMQTTQGRAMGRPGHAHVTVVAADRIVNTVSVSGHAVIVGEGTLYL